MRKSNYLFPALAIGLTAVSCQDYDAGVTADTFKKKEYAENFEKTFGNIDPEQDWNGATRVSGAINLQGIADGICDVLIFNSNPVGGGQLAGFFKVDGTESVLLDLPKSCDKVFISVVDTNGKTLINRYVDIEDGKFVLAAGATRAVTPDVATTVISRVVPQTGEFAANSFNGNTASAPYNFSLYYLEDDATLKSREAGWTVQDMSAIVGEGGTFNKVTPAGFNYKITYPEGYFAEGKNNREIYYSKFSKDVIFTADGGEIYVANEFGGTSYTNQFGYYYYDEVPGNPAATLQNAINAKKIVLMKQAEPQNNIVMQRKYNNYVDERLGDLNSSGEASGMVLPWVITSMYNSNNNIDPNDKIVGSKYRLVYYQNVDSDGKPINPTYNFPAGKKVAFFMKTLSTSYPMKQADYTTAEGNGWNIKFSDHNLNAYYNFLYSGSLPGEEGQGDWEAVTYTMSTKTEVNDNGINKIITTKTVVTGFEDGTDKDLNDILFFVEGVEIEDNLIEEKAKNQAWTIACEDLGGSFDWDFNDMVFTVSFVSSNVAGKATITPMASGGTLPVYLYYNDTKLGGKEFHQLVKSGAPSNATINASSRGTAGASFEIDIPANYSIAYTRGDDGQGVTNMGGFNLRVVQKEGASELEASTLITAPQSGATPQMILIPDTDWAWPTEWTDIRRAYPSFAQFVSDPSVKWWETLIVDETVGKGKSSSTVIIEGGSGNTGGGSGSGTGGSTEEPAYLVAPIMNVTQTASPVYAGDVEFGLRIDFGLQDNGNNGQTAFGDGSKITYTIDKPELFSSHRYVQYGDNSKPTIYLTPTKSGIAKITITHAGDGISYKESVKEVEVIIYAHSNLAATNVTMGCGKTLTLAKGVQITSLSDGAITLSSANTEVATTDGLTINTKTVASSTDVIITVNQAESSDHLYPTTNTTFTLTVDPAAKDPATLTVTKTAIVELVAKGDAGTITKGIDFDFELGASNLGVTYSSSDEAVMTVSESNGIVTINPKAKGTAYVQITSASDNTYDAITLSVASVKVNPAPKTQMSLNQTYDLEPTKINENINGNPETWWIDLSAYSLPTGANKAKVTITYENGGHNMFYYDANKSQLVQFSGWAGSPHTESLEASALFNGEGFYFAFGTNGLNLKKMEIQITE